jgi:TonB family protein
MKPLTVLSVLLIAALIGTSSSAARPQEQPRPKKIVQPTYPDILRAAGIEGTVLLHVFVNEEGKVDKVELIKADNQGLVEAAIEAAKQWEFDPATNNGKAIKAEAAIPFTFRLGDPDLKAKNEALFTLLEQIKGFLRGEPADSVEAHIAPKSYAVIGKEYQPLLPLLSERAKRQLLVEGKNTEFPNIRTVLDNSEDSGCLLMYTRPTEDKPIRYHTLVFMKSADGRWMIQAWQTSY